MTTPRSMSPCECHTQQLTFVFYVRISVWINTTATLIHVPTDVNVIILIAISYMFGKQQKKYTQRTKILELLEATHGHVLLISNLLNICTKNILYVLSQIVYLFAIFSGIPNQIQHLLLDLCPENLKTIF